MTMKRTWQAVCCAACLMMGSVLPGMTMAAEGMWTLDNLPLAALQQLGFKPDVTFVDHVQRSSARLAGGCSGSFVSKDGLVLTNHHCALRCVEQVSSGAKDYVQSGFLTHQKQEELKCPEVEINRLEKVDDVTDVVQQATAGLEGAAFKQAYNAVTARITSNCVGKERSTRRCDVVDLYHGGRYHLYRYHRFQDVRLAFAPEKSAAFFGGDPDNFNFPRFDLDFSLLRVYEDGKPAAIQDYLPFSQNGPQAKELVFVTGHPGTTQRQLTTSQLQTQRDLVVIDELLRLAELRGTLVQYQSRGAEPARTSEALLFGTENTYKALQGRLGALVDPVLFKQKQDEEAELRHYVDTHPQWKARVQGAWQAIEQAQQSYRVLHKPYLTIERSRGFFSTYFALARTLVRGAVERSKPNGDRLPEYVDSKLPEIEQNLFSQAPIYPDLEQLKLTFSLTKLREWLGTDDPIVQQVLGKQSPEQLSAALIAGTHLGDPAVRKALWDGGQAAVQASTDPFIRLALVLDPTARAIRQRYEKEVEAVEQKNTELIAQARFAALGSSTYPDATFTLRLSYGEVKGWDEAGQPVAPFTDFKGAFARHTGAPPFALPPSWLAAQSRLNLAQPLNFVTTNDIIGGNSGSPVINRRGEIVGLIFDGNIHSLGGAYGYDERTNRSVAVHSGAIVEALNKIYGAPELASEITGNKAP